MKRILLFLVCLLILPMISEASTQQCQVRVSYLLKSGIIEEARVRTSARTKKECEKKARTLKVHAAPTKFRKKFLAINWRPKGS